MDPKVYRVKKTWIALRSVLLLFGVAFLMFVASPPTYVILGAFLVAVLLEFADRGLQFLGPDRIYSGEVTVSGEGLEMKTFREKKTIRWDNIRCLREEKSVWPLMRTKYPVLERGTNRKVGFSSGTENYRELVETIVEKGGLELVDTSPVHGGRIWVKKGETYEKKSWTWFNWLEIFVLFLSVIFVVYIIWVALISG